MIGNTGILSKPGFSFVGWNTIADGSGNDFVERDTFSISTANVNLYAKWVNSSTIVMDIDGNVYQTVRIGGQTWTVENLRTTKYNDGTPIPHIKSPIEWREQNSPAFC